jgi:predicted TIM-barrel fold metal-dependent hydrolase
VNDRDHEHGVTDMRGCVAPGMELVYERGTPEFRGVWLELEKRLVLTQPLAGHGDWRAPYLQLPTSDARPIHGRDTWHPAATNGGSGSVIAHGVLHDNPAGRLAAMDAAGVARQLISPGPTIDACMDLPSNFGAGVFGAYNNYVTDYCEADPRRLKAVLHVHGVEPHWSAREIRDFAENPSVAAVSICLPVRISPEERNFSPIWEALEETGLPVLHRQSFSAAVWSPSRLLNYLRLTGVLERFPNVRFGFLGSEARWVGEALAHLTAAPGGGSGLDPARIFAAVSGPHAIAELGDALDERARSALVWESSFPLERGLADSVAAMGALPGGERRAILEDNPARFLGER